MIRQPAVAGQFYPEREAALRNELRNLLPGEVSATEARGLIAPHAGYVFSGAIAAATFARVRIPHQVILLGPNHHGYGSPLALSGADAWSTPLGDVPVDGDLAEQLRLTCPGLAVDDGAHRQEHSLEVMIPFLQMLQPELRIVPICIGQASLDSLLELGTQIGRALAGLETQPLLVASTDMTHYESGEEARRKDQHALGRVLALDPQGLYQTVRGERISMCGVLPVVTALAAALELGAVSADLVRYGNSGDVTGDQGQVVGYAGVVIS